MFNTLQYIPELWRVCIAPLVLDAFTMYLWAPPLISSLLNRPTINGHIPNINPNTTPIIVIITMLTFFINVRIAPYIKSLHGIVDVTNSPLFRSLWVFVCTTAITRYTGAIDIMSFAVVVFLPLIYVRVPQGINSVSAIYALMFLTLTIGRSILMLWRKENTGPEAGIIVPPDVYSIGMYWFMFCFTSIYHFVWISSHVHTQEIDSISHTIQNIRKNWETSAIPIATFRSIVLILCVFVREKPCQPENHTWYAFHETVEFLQILFLFITISTFTAWTHCQHAYENKFNEILTSTVVSGVSGVIVENIEQMTFLAIIATFTIFIEIRGVKNMERHKYHPN